MAHVKGTGLGLFIVKSIAKKHGGTAFALSPGEGQGTTVVIELPKTRTEPQKADTSRPQA
jgi:signal transduction histidine kinase